MDPSLRWSDGDEGRLGLHHDEQTFRHALHWRDERSGGASLAASRRHRLEILQRYGLKRLVYAEQHARIDEAIAREKMMKSWNRNWKLRQIMEMNPDWDDLFERINH